jgi:ataxia telangiectasia mutated family protein
MELEDKVLGWLVTFWNVFDGTTKGLNAKSKLENHSPDDVLRLLTSICRLEKRVPLVYHPFLPDSPVVTRMYLVPPSRLLRIPIPRHRVADPFSLFCSFDFSDVEAQAESAVVRDWVLFARLRLPRTLPSSTTSSSFTSSSAPITDTSAMDLQSPSGRARKVSAFLLKSVESLKAFWSDADPESNATIEKIRRSVDLVVLAVCFEASLQVNGTTQNRRTIKDASYLVSAILPLLSSTRLSTLDMAVIIQGLEPLVQTKEKRIETRPALLWAGEAAGLKKELLPILDESKGKEIKAEEKLRSAMQRIVWQSSDVRLLFILLF